jgi:hypothetical protein
MVEIGKSPQETVVASCVDVTLNAVVRTKGEFFTSVRANTIPVFSSAGDTETDISRPLCSPTPENENSLFSVV